MRILRKLWEYLTTPPKHKLTLSEQIIRKNNSDIIVRSPEWSILDNRDGASARVLKTQEELMQQELDENVHECVKNVRSK